MDILNFISWIRGGRVVTTVNPAQTLLPVGLKDNRRDDGYLAGAISVEDLVTQLTPTPTYKVFTALLAQSGGDDPIYANDEILTIGRTYTITNTDGGTVDFTNVGAPNNNLNTSFIATGETANSWGITNGGQALYNTGAPVATVLENTIGNVWFGYIDVGNYSVNSNGLFTLNKSLGLISTLPLGVGDGSASSLVWQTIDTFKIENGLIAGISFDTILYNTPIEIRVYE